MSGVRVPVYWICGAPAAGKSVAAWALFNQLAAGGVRVAYVDIDQLGMLYPAPESDPDRHLLKVQALVALLPGYVSAGAQVVVVSGVVDPQMGPDAASRKCIDLKLCMLASDPSVLHERLVARGWGEEMVAKAMAEDTALRGAAFVDAVLETAELSVDDTATQLRSITEVALGSVDGTVAASSTASSPVVIVTGARAAGSSTVGFGLAMRRWKASQRTGFLDLQQLTFLAGPGVDGSLRSALATAQLAAMHDVMTGVGAAFLVVSGHLSSASRPAVRDALPQARVEIVRLRADAATFTAHVQERFWGRGPRLAGDDLTGADTGQQLAVVSTALEEQQQMDNAADGEKIVDVTSRVPADVVAEVESFVAGRLEGIQR